MSTRRQASKPLPISIKLFLIEIYGLTNPLAGTVPHLFKSSSLKVRHIFTNDRLGIVVTANQYNYVLMKISRK